jgi:hypothetical protein
MDNPDTSGSERRRSARLRPGRTTTRVVCQRGELFLGPNLAESLEDASEEGLGLVARETLAEGERVSLSLEGVGLASELQRLGRVAWCAPAEGGLFRAGVELDAPFSYAELMALTSL